MNHKKWIILSTLCLLLATNTTATLTITQPTAHQKEITTTPNTPTTIQITIKNDTNTTINNITPTTDLNATFSDTKFGLDPAKEKTITLTITKPTNTTGTINIGDKNFALKIIITQQPGLTQLITQKIEKNQPKIYEASTTITFIVIALLVQNILTK